MKEQYLSKTPNETFVYLSKCNIKLPCYFINSKKRVFVNRSSVYFFYLHPSIALSSFSLKTIILVISKIYSLLWPRKKQISCAQNEGQETSGNQEMLSHWPSAVSEGHQGIDVDLMSQKGNNQHYHHHHDIIIIIILPHHIIISNITNNRITSSSSS